MLQDLKAMKNEMMMRFRDCVVNAVAWLPIFILGLIFFVGSTMFDPTGTLADFRLKMGMVFGKSFIAIYLGQLLWNLLFPKLDEHKLDLDDLDSMPAKHYNIMYGRLILHAILQLIFYNI